MNAAQIISWKRDGGELDADEIGWFVAGFTQGEIPDYQMSALAMAIFLNGMSPVETAALTEAMLHSGVVMNWPAEGRPKVDKHSTGGIGDKVSLILAPWLACCGVDVPMISGRGLGPSGGTLDKLEAIPGYRTDLSLSEFQQVIADVGCAISGASDEIAPADRRLYALRDVTGTVPSIPLITASIMSKKLAEGLDALVLDVKYGSGAFMKTEADAQELAGSLAKTGCRMGVKTLSLLTDMNQPLGRAVGNALEVDEALEALQGRGPDDLMLVTRNLAVLALGLARGLEPTAAGRQLDQQLASGAAFRKFAEMVAAQGGDLAAARPLAPRQPFLADRSGQLQWIDAERLGYAVIELGGGRKRQGDVIDPSVGLIMQVRVGDSVAAGDSLLELCAAPHNGPAYAAAISCLAEAFVIE